MFVSNGVFYKNCLIIGDTSWYTGEIDTFMAHYSWMFFINQHIAIVDLHV